MYQTILLPVDLGDEFTWRHAVPTATSLCEMYHARLYVITVVADLNLPVVGHIISSNEEARLHESIASKLDLFIKARISPAIETRRLVASGKVYQQILGHAARLKADLVIMGASSAEMNGYLLGSNIARVVRHARCSVMIVRDWGDTVRPSPYQE